MSTTERSGYFTIPSCLRSVEPHHAAVDSTFEMAVYMKEQAEYNSTTRRSRAVEVSLDVMTQAR